MPVLMTSVFDFGRIIDSQGKEVYYWPVGNKVV